MATAADVTLEYHQQSKHHPSRYARSLGYMDWATQPDPFRRFEGARVLPLDLIPVDAEPRYEPAFVRGGLPARPLNRAAVSQLLQDALALSAWKQAGTSRWALRVNPSSGNLHPTEGYLVSGPIPGLHDQPAVYHYAPSAHALELRTELAGDVWDAIARQLPGNTVLIGLSSIYWREAWKYGERAFRYCHHDAGHAIASVAVAAAGLGWETRLLEGVTDDDLAALLGVAAQSGVEAEHADCLISVCPPGALTDAAWRTFTIPPAVSHALRAATWIGVPNTLSSDHHDWAAIAEVADATIKQSPPPDAFWTPTTFDNSSLEIGDAPISLRQIVHQRRSAVAFDGRTAITRAAFYQMLLKTMPGAQQVPFTTLPWQPRVDLLLFVHRVSDLAPGLYLLLRDPNRRSALEAATSGSAFAWTTPDACPSSLPLVLLQEADTRRAARQTSCGQDIAADGVFAAAMLVDYRAPLDAFGPWFYRRLYWETGVVGQVLYLEAEASGIRGTGIGCFFDDLTHQVLGLSGDRFQVLYHFTVGGAVDDARLQTHPPYQHLDRATIRPVQSHSKG